MENNFSNDMQNGNMFASNNANLAAAKTPGAARNIIVSVVASLIGAVITFVLTLVIYKLGFIAGIAGLAGVCVAILLGSKFGNGVTIPLVVLSILFSLVAVYFGNYVGIIQELQSEFESLYSSEITFSQAQELHETGLEYDSEYKMAYYGDLIKGFVFTIAAGVAYVIQSIKKAR